jgi:N,N'-diacetyllegionaminate synthase
MINSNDKVLIIAEAGVNHNGDISLAKKLIDIAYQSGADAVKFQTWKSGEITGRFAIKVPYLEEATNEEETRFELSKKLCLSYDTFRELKIYSEKVGIEFLSTPDGFESLDFLVDELDMSIIKVGSTELNHISFLESIGSKKRPVILSTGLGTLAEVDIAISALRRGGGTDLPITLLQCTSQYPAPPEEMNLHVIKTYAQAFSVAVGLSDHSSGIEAAIASVAIGASVIEKHFTLDRNLEGPDHAASLEPGELKDMVEALHRVKIMLGNGVKAPTLSEKNNMKGIRRSVVASRDLDADSLLTVNDLICKRPGTGVAPPYMTLLIGRKIKKSMMKDEPFHWNDLV